ncbi:MAG TPA: nucleic acid-binding protein [Myxococcales bacterium]|nr:nucleic acid-binding protein [Myxococcales bacterium]
MTSLRPAPSPSRDSAFFWEGLNRDVLLGQRCSNCQKFRHPPRPMCPRCQSLDWQTIELSCRGTLHAVVRPVHPPLPTFGPDCLVALIDLPEGIRLLSNLCEIDLYDAQIGMEVEVFFVETESGDKIHQFRPIGGALG